jgi:hypothetical protein
VIHLEGEGEGEREGEREREREWCLLFGEGVKRVPCMAEGTSVAPESATIANKCHKGEKECELTGCNSQRAYPAFLSTLTYPPSDSDQLTESNGQLVIRKTR